MGESLVNEVVSTDLANADLGLYSGPRSRVSHTDRLSWLKKMFI